MSVTCSTGNDSSFIVFDEITKTVSWFTNNLLNIGLYIVTVSAKIPRNNTNSLNSFVTFKINVIAPACN